MGNFSGSTKGRSWILTVQMKNLKTLGFSEAECKNPEYVCSELVRIWSESGRNRKAGAVFCLSPNLLPHVHMGLYGGYTTLRHVAEVMGDSHTEPVMGSKDQLLDYLLKQGNHEHSEEQILCKYGLENIEGRERKRTDLDAIAQMIEEGYSPNEIFAENFGFRRFSTMIFDAYKVQRQKALPRHLPNMIIEWHYGLSGTGKTTYAETIMEEFGDESVYVVSDYDNGGFDSYLSGFSAFADILVLEELRPFSLRFNVLLNILSGSTRYEIHSRFHNVPCLWSKVIIISPYDPYTFYTEAVSPETRKHESYRQLSRRITSVNYHFIDDTGVFRCYSMPMSVYQKYSGSVEFIKEAKAYAAAGLMDLPTELMRLHNNDLIQIEDVNGNADEILSDLVVSEKDQTL